MTSILIQNYAFSWQHFFALSNFKLKSEVNSKMHQASKHLRLFLRKSLNITPSQRKKILQMSNENDISF